MSKVMIQIKALNFLVFSTFAILLPYLPLLLAERGFSIAQIGLLLMVGPFFAIFLQPIVGFISDKWHAVKRILLLLWCLTGLSAVGLFYINSKLFSVIFVVSLFMFFLSAIPLVDTLTVKMAENFKSTYSTIRLWGSIGFCIVAVFLGAYFERIGGLDALIKIYFPIWLAALLILFNLKEFTSKESSRFNWRDLVQLIGDKRIFIFLIFLLFLAVPHRMNDALFSIYFKELGANDSMISWAWAIIGLSEIIGFYMSAKLLKGFHPLKLIIAATLFYIIRWVCYVYTAEPYILLVLQLFQAITYSLFWASAVNYMVIVVPKQFRTTSQSLLAMIFLGVSGILGGSIGGAVQQNYGGSYMYVFAAWSVFIALVGFIALRKQAASAAVNSEVEGKKKYAG
ncbi:MFS transporter [Paenibacillus algorifonticola]|uniref:MFS transporter n=1 Tax=Paenibacillus algorifonticola TaxID=684063 RepID=UPI003D2CA406